MSARRNFHLISLAVVITCLAGCNAKSPVPPQVLADLKAYVENDGREVPQENIFIMPSGLKANTAAGDQVEVTNIRFDGTAPPLNQPVNDIPTGTVLHTFEIWDTRVKLDGTTEREQLWFYVYVDSSGQWHFVKRLDNPYG